MPGMVIEVSYGVDWDEREALLVHPLSEARARERHETGEPYTTVVSAGSTPRAVLRVCRGIGYASLHVFDSEGRRARDYEFRELWQDHLHLLRLREWQVAADPLDEDARPAFAAEIPTDGRARIKLEREDGGSTHTWADVPAEFRTVAMPAFGDWTALIDAGPSGAAEPSAVAPGPAPNTGAEPSSAPRPGWAEALGARPGNLAALFTAGSRLRSRDGVAVILEPEDAGLLLAPTGRIIAADPGTLDEEDEPFTVAVAPGAYPVQIARMRWEEHPWGETPAARLVIRAEVPTVGWELALRPGQDMRMLNAGEFYGFGVDSGTGSFLDLAARESVVETVRERPEEFLSFEEGANHGWWRDPEAGVNLVAYPSGYGDGRYPVWIGRGPEGEVTSLVADMLVFHDAETLEPTPMDTAAFLAPAPQRLPAAEAPTPGTLAAATEYLAAMRTQLVRPRY